MGITEKQTRKNKLLKKRRIEAVEMWALFGETEITGHVPEIVSHFPVAANL